MFDTKVYGRGAGQLSTPGRRTAFFGRWVWLTWAIILVVSGCSNRADADADADADAGGGYADAGGGLQDNEFGWSLELSRAETRWLLSTWGSSDDNRYAVGGTPEEGEIFHFDGRAWQSEALPAVPLLNWVFGFTASRVYAVGNRGTLLEYDGKSWNTRSLPTQEDLWGVWGSSPDSLWAVGGDGKEGSMATILHFDGSRWAEVTPPLVREGVHAYYKVWGSGPNDVYVVGQNGAVQHFDGDTWTELDVGASDDLIAVWGLGPDHVIAVGGRSSAVVAYFNGAQWDTRTLRLVPAINGVWFDGPNEAHLALTQGYLGRLSVPQLEVSLEPWEDVIDFHALHGTPDGTLTAVALNAEGLTVGRHEGLVVRREYKRSTED